MNFDKLFEEFIDEIQGEGTYASSDEVRIATKEMLDVIKNNKDATPDELVELIIKDNLDINGDLVISSYVLNELDQNSRINAINKMWNMTNKMMLIVEPGTPEGFSLIREIRDYLISIGAYVIAPCTHMGVCLNTWCHFSTRVSRSKLHKDLKGGDAPYEDEKYCYIAFSKNEVIPCKNRILRHPQINPGFIELEVCSKEGFKKIKYSKKDKELFKKARKSNAGDQI